MKKMLSLMLVPVLSVTAFSLPAAAYTGHVNDGETPQFSGATANNAFGDLLDWTGVVFGNTNNVIDVEGTLAVGGDFVSSTGFSANWGAYGRSPATTEDVALMVNGNVNITGYGDVYGQTVIGSAEGNTYHLTNVTPSATTNGQYTVANALQYFADAKSTALDVKASVETLAANGVCNAENGTYTFVGDADKDVLVYNVDEAVFDSYLFDFTIADGQTVVVNLTAPGKIEFKNGGYRINGSNEAENLRNYNRNMIINVVNATEIEMTSCELYGILLAPDADLTGAGSSVCGTSVLNGLTGSNGFELHVGYNNAFVPSVPVNDPDPAEDSADTVGIRIDVPRKMAVAFDDGSVYYGGEMKEVEYGKEYLFQMCSVNWENGLLDDNGNGIRGTVVYRMKVVHRNEFLALAKEAKEDPERYVVKGMDVIDNETKTITINGDAADAHLETDVNSFFVAYRFHFAGSNYNKKTGIDGVVQPLESLSVNLPLGSTVTCNAYHGDQKVNTANVFITTNSGEGDYDNEYLTSVNDYTWE